MQIKDENDQLEPNRLARLEVVIENLSEDIKELKEHVEELREDYFTRKANSKIIYGIITISSLFAGYLISFFRGH